MATITGLTADRMQAIIDKTIVSANIVSGHLILTLSDGSTVDAGDATGPAGAPGIQKVTAFPASPADGDIVVRTDQTGDPVYKYTTASGWVLLAGGLAKVTAFPSAPSDGDGVVRTDLNGSPVFMYSTENGWEQLPRMGAVTVPNARVYASTAPTGLANNTFIATAFNSEEYDTDSIHDVAVNNTRFTIKTPGTYLLRGFFGWLPSAAGSRWLQFNKNGVLIPGARDDRAPASAASSRISLTATVKLAAGDYIEMVSLQDSGASLDASDPPYCEVVWMGGPGQTVDERGVPACRGIASGTVVPSGAWTALAFDSEAYDTDSIHDSSVNTTRMTIKTPGIYSLAGFVADDTIGLQTIAHLRVNGSIFIAPSYLAGPAASFTGNRPVVTQYQFAAGDYIELVAQQPSGSSHTINGALALFMVSSAKTVTPFARVTRSTSQIINSGANAFITFDSEDADNDGIHDTVTNTDRVTAQTAGIYLIVCEAQFDSVVPASGTQLLLEKNTVGAAPTGGASVINAGAGVGFFGLAVGVAELAKGDWVRAWLGNRAGVNLDVNGSSLMLVKIGAPHVGGSPSSAQADVFTLATLPAASAFPPGRMVLVSDGAAGQQARMSTGSAWINLG